MTLTKWSINNLVTLSCSFLLPIFMRINIHVSYCINIYCGCVSFVSVSSLHSSLDSECKCLVIVGYIDSLSFFRVVLPSLHRHPIYTAPTSSDPLHSMQDSH